MNNKNQLKRPLSGLRIADFTWIGAGSYTTKILADSGAEVLKIESRTHPDSLRNSPPFAEKIPGVNRSGYFADRNSSKKSITLNLKTPQGLKLAKDIIARSDIIANNFAAGTMEKLGLGYKVVQEIKPDIIYLDMSMQGSYGPEHKYIGYGLTIAALTGMQYLSGLPDREPIGTGTNYPDHIPNPTHAAFAVLAAVRHRRLTGEGQYIDMAQTEPTIALLGPAFLSLGVTGNEISRHGNNHLNGKAPHGVYPCNGDDSWIAIAVVNDEQWLGLTKVLGDDFPVNWNTASKRWEKRTEVDGFIAQKTQSWDSQELMEALQKHRVPAGAVLDAQGVVHDSQLAFRNHWCRLDHPEMGRSLYNSPPFRFSRSPNELRSAAPLLGEHTREICKDLLNLSDDDIDRLLKDGALN